MRLEIIINKVHMVLLLITAAISCMLMTQVNQNNNSMV